MTQASSHRSSALTVEPQWIDHNGHLNMAYYHVLFDRGADELFAKFGIDPDYIARTGHSTFSAEFHVCYLRELHVGAKVYVTSQMLDFDEKRFHFYQELHHEDGWLSATGEGMGLHIDLSGPRVAPMLPEVYQKMKELHSEHSKLPYPKRAGRKISMGQQ